MVKRAVPSPPRFFPSIFIAHRIQQSHCSSICHRVLLTHALALSASKFVHKKKSQRIYTSMHSVGLELTKLTYTRLEDNLIRHRGDLRKISDPNPHRIKTRSTNSMRVDEGRKGSILLAKKTKARTVLGSGEKSLRSDPGSEYDYGEHICQETALSALDRRQNFNN